jgi:hypothetical protein
MTETTTTETTKTTTIDATARAGATPAAGLAAYEGACHCGAVRFQVRADLSKGASRCNCSICVRIAQLGVLVKPEAFTLVAGAEALSFYEWGMKISQRYFCGRCGIHCFGRGNLPEVGGDFVSVNLNCLEGIDPAELKVVYWDGRHNNWEAGTRDRPWPIHPAHS